MIGRRIRRVLLVAGYVLGGLIVVLAITLTVWRVTNPGPRDAARWSSIAEMPQARGEVASAIVGTRFVVAGGLYGIGRTSDAVHVYEVSRNEWTRIRSLPAPRHHAAAAGLGGFVYLAGGAPGATDWTATDTVWRARPGLPWRAVAPMPEGRQGHAMVALRGRLYVIGGVGDTDTTLIYDPRTDRWTRGSALLSGRDHLRAVAWRDEIWALGGRHGGVTSRVDIYDPATDRWREGPALPKAMSAMAVGVLEDGLHVVGGEDPRFFLGTVTDEHYVLAAASRRWRSASRQLLPVHGAGYAVHAGRFLVAGGATREGLLSTISWTS
ncbi:MAG: Kelch repeat-containing protein, partial [Actinomycetota bacterium]